MGFQVSVIIKRYSRFEKVCSFLYDLVIDTRLSDTVSDRSQSLHSGDVESGIALNRYVYVRQYTLLVLRRRFSSNTAVHRDFKVCKTSQNIPPLVSLPQRPLRLPEGGGFGFCHSRPGSSDMHTHKNESRDMHTCQTELPDHTDTHWSPVQKCATVPPLRQSLS